MSFHNPNPRGRSHFDFEATPHESVAHQHPELFNVTTNRLDSLSAVKILYESLLSVKTTYETLFSPSIYKRADNIHRMARSLISTVLDNATVEIENLELHPLYYTPDFAIARHMAKECRMVCANIDELLGLVSGMELADLKKQEYNLADLVLILRGRCELNISGNKLTDVQCDEESPSKHVFRYEMTLSSEPGELCIIIYYTPYPMHELTKVEQYIRTEGVANLPCYKIEKR